MTRNPVTTKISYIFSACLIVLLALGTFTMPAQAQAQAPSRTYSPDTIEEFIAYLYGMIAQLQAQLDAKTGGGDVAGWNGEYQITLDTLSVHGIEEDEAELRSNIDLDGAAYANTWFEYGERGNLDERTETLRITNRGDDTRSFTRVIGDLDEDTRYYFRPVAAGPDGRRLYGSIGDFRTDDDTGRNDGPGDRSNQGEFDDDEPEVETQEVDRISDDEAYLYGRVDMNDYENGDVFFVFGINESEIEDATEESTFSAIDTRRDELMKFRVDRGFDGNSRYYGRLYGLEADTRYYYTICVEVEDDDEENVLICGDVEDFRTDD